MFAVGISRAKQGTLDIVNHVGAKALAESGLVGTAPAIASAVFHEPPSVSGTCRSHRMSSWPDRSVWIINERVSVGLRTRQERRMAQRMLSSVLYRPVRHLTPSPARWRRSRAEEGPAMLRSMTDLKGFTIGATDGDMGHVEAFYFDDTSFTVRHLVVKTAGWLSGRKVLVSPIALRDVDWDGRRINVALSKSQVEQSPPIDAEEPVSRQQEVEYYGY